MPRHPFYNSRIWKQLRKVKLATDPLCEYCHVKPATSVDHRLAINQGGHPTEWSNLVASCHECHSRKTLFVERLGRDRVPVKGCDSAGMPLDPLHPWNDKGTGEIVDSEANKQKFAGTDDQDRALVEEES